jgi:hypothetical protein
MQEDAWLRMWNWLWNEDLKMDIPPEDEPEIGHF